MTNHYPPSYERWPGDNGVANYTPPQPPPKSSKRTLWILGGILAGLVVLVLCLVGVFTAGNTKPTVHLSQAPTTTASRDAKVVPPTHATKASPKPVTIKDGRYAVAGSIHTDNAYPAIQPGTYVTTADPEGPGCYWSRLRDFDGSINSIMDNGLLSPGAKGVIEIKRTDKGAELSGGCVWVKIK